MNTETNTAARRAATLTRAPMVDLSRPDQIAAWKPDAELLPEQKLTVEECKAAYKAARASTGLKEGFDTLVKAKMVAFHLAPTNPGWVWLAMANLVVRQLKAKLAPSPQDREGPARGLLLSWSILSFDRCRIGLARVTCQS
jgi:hypothetical protein